MSKAYTLTLYLLLIACFYVNAQVQVPFTPRFNESLNGEVTIIANNMLSRHPTNDYNGNGDNQDFNDNIFVDIDNDNTTFNSSSANFTNPDPSVDCISVYRAFLYWVAADKEPNPGGDNQPNWNYNDIKVMLPGEITYTTMTADDIIFRGRDTHFSNDPYICFKDITAQVQALPQIYGTYQIANVEAKTGALRAHDDGNSGTAGGWQIVFVYEGVDLPSKSITLFDGYAHVTEDENDFDIDFSGFQTIPAGNVSTKLVIGSLEGDRDLFEDRLQIRNPANVFVDITAPLRNPNNFFNSRITVGNADYIDRNPASTNTLGFDAAIFDLDNTNNSIITNNQTSATMRMTSDSEIYGLYLLGLSVEVRIPNLNPTILTQISGNNPANPSDTLGFSFSVINSGNDDAINIILTTILPPQVTFSGVVNLPAGVDVGYDTVTRELVFKISDGLADIGDPVVNLQFELEVEDECYFLEDNCDLSFDLQFNAIYNGVENSDEQVTLTTSDATSCEPLPLTININQPVVNWLTNAGDLDRTLSCEDTAGLNAAQALEPMPDKCTFTLIKTSGTFQPDANCPNAGTYTNSWNFTDACGVTIADYVQVITITDDSPPTASNLPDVNVQCIEDVPPPDINDVSDAADNCSTPIVAFVSDVPDNQSCPFTIVRTYSVTDTCGSAINVTQNIVVNDDEVPTASNPAPINLSCGDTIPAPDINVVTDEADNCANPVVAFVSDVSNGLCPEIITRTFSITDACNNSTLVTQDIIFGDTEGPELSTSYDDDLTVSCEDIPDAPILQFQDDCSANLTVVFTETDTNQNNTVDYVITREWVVTDECGNDSTFTQTINVLIADCLVSACNSCGTTDDTIPPTASDPADLTLNCISDIPLPDPAVVIDEADNCVPPVVTFISETVNVDCFERVIRTYRVTDECGNFVDVTHTINVVDNVFPTASDPVPITVSCINDVPVPDVNAVTDDADNCGSPTVAFVSDISNNLTCPETITRTYSVTDACGNAINVSQTILIDDDIPPTLTSNLETDVNITCEAIPAIPTLEFADNCTANVDVNFTEATTNIDALSYDIVRSWVVTDDCNNQDTFTQTIYVRRIEDTDTIAADLCVEDPAIDLNTFVTNTDNLSGIWQSDTAGVLNGTVFNPIGRPLEDYHFTYTYMTNDCVFVTDLTIRLNDDCVYYPCIAGKENVSIVRAVTPNNDGFNDFFTVNYNLNPQSNEVCNIAIDVKIFDRWGTRVFHSTDYNNNWNGSSPSSAMGNADKLPTGTYFYIVDFKNSGLKPIQGYIYLGVE